MVDKIVAEYKQKEFERLRYCILNFLSSMECDLNPKSQSRGISRGDILVPLDSEIRQLFKLLLELRSNILSPEERKLLND